MSTTAVAGVDRSGAVSVVSLSGAFARCSEVDGVATWPELYAAAVALDAELVFCTGVRLVDDARAAAAVGLTVDVSGEQGGAWRWFLHAPGTAPVYVVDVSSDSQGLAGPWGGLTPRELLDALHTVGQLLRVPWGSSIGRTVQGLILATHPKGRGGVLLDRGPVCPDVCDGSTLELPWMNWRRPLTEVEARGGWVHVFDANAQFLSAWVNVQLGHGQPVNVREPGFDPKVAGVWRVPGLAGLRMPGFELLPVPWLEGGREWFTTPTVARALEVTDGLVEFPEVVESWRWPARSRFLRAAGERIRDARAAAMGAAAAARRTMWAGQEADAWAATGELVRAQVTLEAVKSLYRRGTGRFSMSSRDRVSGWYRPDWGHMIRATSRVNLHRALCKLSAAPVAIATDALAFVTGEPDPARFAARIGLATGDGLGRFRHVSTCAAGAIAGELEAGMAGQIIQAAHGAHLAGARG